MDEDTCPKCSGRHKLKEHPNTEWTRQLEKAGFVVDFDDSVPGREDSLDYNTGEDGNGQVSVIQFHRKGTDPAKERFVINAEGEVNWVWKGPSRKAKGKYRPLVHGERYTDPPIYHGIAPKDKRIYFENNNWFQSYRVVDGEIEDNMNDVSYDLPSEVSWAIDLANGEDGGEDE